MQQFSIVNTVILHSKMVESEDKEPCAPEIVDTRQHRYLGSTLNYMQIFNCEQEAPLSLSDSKGHPVHQPLW